MTPSKSNLRCARLALGAPGLEGFTTALPHEQKGCPKRQRAEVSQVTKSSSCQESTKTENPVSIILWHRNAKVGSPSVAQLRHFDPPTFLVLEVDARNSPPRRFRRRQRLARLLAPTKDPVFKTGIGGKITDRMLSLRVFDVEIQPRHLPARPALLFKTQKTTTGVNQILSQIQ